MIHDGKETLEDSPRCLHALHVSVEYINKISLPLISEQESYVWKMYQERCWEFFPAGDCFRKQYEDQLG